MRRRHTDELDLQQLRVLNALFREHSLTKAAEALNTTQPAISKSLARMRRYFDDPLFIRVASGMDPTPKALELEGQIRALLEGIDLLRRENVPFDPRKSDRTFSFFGVDAAFLVLVPQLIQLLADLAPDVRLRAVQLDAQHLHSALESGDVDLAVGVFPSLAQGIRRQRLFSATYMSLARKGNPRLGVAPQFGEFVKERHVLLTTAGTGHAHQATERVLEELIPARNIIVRVPGFAAAALVAKQIDAIATLPGPVAALLARELDMQLMRVPADLPKFEVAQYWHERYDREPGNRWLRSLIHKHYTGSHPAGKKRGSGN